MDNHPTAAPSCYSAHFSSDDVLEVVGINDATLQNWLARGRLNLERQNPGRGKPRQYTVYEVARIHFIKKLVDLGFPLAPAFKITAALKKLWEAVPGGHEEYAREPNLESWLLVVPAEAWKTHVDTTRRLSRSVVQAEGYIALWAVEIIGSSRTGGIRDAINHFADTALIIVNMGVLLHQTVSRLEQRLDQRDG
jgi:DNA-binding transcriptional MerR regulator